MPVALIFFQPDAGPQLCSHLATQQCHVCPSPLSETLAMQQLGDVSHPELEQINAPVTPQPIGWDPQEGVANKAGPGFVASTSCKLYPTRWDTYVKSEKELFSEIVSET